MSIADAPREGLRVAMTAADIPLTTGQASQGGEGVRFMGVTAYDALVNWDVARRVAAHVAAGPRGELVRRSETPDRMDVSIARGRDVPRRLSVHRRRRRVEPRQADAPRCTAIRSGAGDTGGDLEQEHRALQRRRPADRRHRNPGARTRNLP